MSGFHFSRGRHVINKHPRSILDYGVRLSRWIPPGDSIPANPAPSWEISAGLSMGVSAYLNGVAYIVLSGGVAGSIEWARCTWTTTAGRREQQTLYFAMVE